MPLSVAIRHRFVEGRLRDVIGGDTPLPGQELPPPIAVIGESLQSPLFVDCYRQPPPRRRPSKAGPDLPSAAGHGLAARTARRTHHLAETIRQTVSASWVASACSSIFNGSSAIWVGSMCLSLRRFALETLGLFGVSCAFVGRDLRIGTA